MVEVDDIREVGVNEKRRFLMSGMEFPEHADIVERYGIEVHPATKEMK